MYFRRYEHGCDRVSECVEFNVPLDTQYVISGTSFSSQSLDYGPDNNTNACDTELSWTKSVP